MKTLITKSADAWRLLNGVFCLYKYADLNSYQLRKRIANVLLRDLNSLEPRKPRDLVRIKEPLDSSGELTVFTEQSFADNILVVGPRHQFKDFSLGWATDHGPLTTGLSVLGIGKQASYVQLLKEKHLVRTYQIAAKFGFVTDDLTDTGKVLEKSSYKHMNEEKMERIMAAIQAAHQTVAFRYAGVRLDSQKAYELASRGMVRPAEDSQFLLYGIRCLSFQPPDFTVEVQCINENEEDLKALVHDIGCRSKCWATTSKVRMIRYGPFTLEQALLRKHWTLEHIIENIQICKPIFNQVMYLSPRANLEQIKL